MPSFGGSSNVEATTSQVRPWLLVQQRNYLAQKKGINKEVKGKVSNSLKF